MRARVSDVLGVAGAAGVGVRPPTADVALPDAEARSYATDPRRNVVLEASAGTGKTSVLVARYLNLLSLEVDPSNILAITFTRKAAAEMRERIVTALRRASAESPDGRTRWLALRDRLNDVSISTIDAFCYGLLREFPLEAGLDPAFTLADETEVARLVEEALDHAIRICQKIASEDPDVALVFARLTGPRLRAGLAHLLERRLVAQAALARYLQRGPRDLTVEIAAARAADRMRDTLRSVPPGGPGALQAFLADGPVQHARFRLLSSDLRALDLGEVTEPARLAAVFDEIRAYFLTQSGSPRTRLTGYTTDHCASRASWKRHCEAVKAIAPAVKQSLDAWARDLNVMLARGVQRMFAVALREYRQTLAEHEVLDFADVLGRAVDLLRQMDEFSQSRYRLESRYHHVLVDEFQDTSRMQWELVSLLVASWGEGFGLVHEAPLPPSLFVVGDRKQSIYRFRDADVSLLDDAARAITALRPEGPVRRVISRSFRSVPALLALVNDLCGALPESTRGDAFRYDEGDRFPLDGLVDPFTLAPFAATAPFAAAPVTAAPFTVAPSSTSPDTLPSHPDPDPHLHPHRPPHVRLRPPPLGVVVGDSIEACAASVADEIARLLAEGVVRDRDSGVAREARPGDIAILFRSRDSHREFEHALEARGIPSYVYKGLGFFDADEIKDLSALMRYLAAPESNLRAAAFLRSRFVRLSDAALRELGPDLAAVLAPSVTPAMTARDGSAAMESATDHASATPAVPGAASGEARLSEEDRGVLARLRVSLPEWLALVDRLPPAELIDHILAASAYGLEIGGVRGHQARENVKKMRGLVRRIQNRGYATLGRIAEHLDRLSAGDEANATIEALDAVSLMTVHASKGLEFPVVFLVNIARGVAARRQPIRVLVDPHGDETNVAVESFISEADTLEPAKEREETKRLLYVALTRARDTLYLSTLLKDGQFKPTPGSLGSIMPPSMTVLFEAAGRSEAGSMLGWTAPGGHVHEFVNLAKPVDTASDSTSPAALESHPPLASDPAPSPSEISGITDRAPNIPDAWPRVRVTSALRRGATRPPVSVDRTGSRAMQALAGRLVHRLFQARADADAPVDAVTRHAQRLMRGEEQLGLESPEEIARQAAETYQRVARREDVRTLLSSGACLYEVPFSLRLPASGAHAARRGRDARDRLVERGRREPSHRARHDRRAGASGRSRPAKRAPARS